MWIVKSDAGGSENQGIKVLWPYWYIQLFLLKSDQRSWYCLIHVYCKACRWILIFFFQTDHIYIQSLRGILDIHESGVNETNFHEVSIQNSHMSFAYFNLMHFTHSQIHIGTSLTYNRMCDFYLNSFGFIKTKRGPFILFLPLFCLYM